MSRPAVFFDRDNTLIANDDYLGDPAGVVLIEGAADAVARVRALGFATVVVSNQSGVARGMFDEEAVQAVNARMDQALLEIHPDALIERHEYCPHHPDGTVEDYKGDSARRKPQPGMLLDAAEAMGLDLRRSWLIGDAPRDIEAGQRAGCRTILVRDGTLPPSPATRSRMNVPPDYVASSLADAVDFIEMQLETPEDGLTDPPVPSQAPLISAEHAGDEGDIVHPSTQEDVVIEEADDRGEDEQEVVNEARTDDAHAGPVELAPFEQPPADRPLSPAAPAPVASVTSGLGAMSDAIVASAPPSGSDRQTVLLLERVVEELRRANDPPQDFSVPRMLAGVVQGFALASLFGALLFRDAPPPSTTFNTLIMIAIFLQAMVSSLLLMGR